MSTLVSMAFALFAGLMMTRVFKALHFNFPDVTAFLIAGLLVGPYGIGALGIPGIGFPTTEAVGELSLVSSAALGFIAFSIGSEFKKEKMQEIGRETLIIGIFQAVFAALVVDCALYAFHKVLGPEKLPLPVCITLGAIGAATAPAATLMVVKQYKAKGPVTSLLLPIVALDDAVGLVVFAISMGIAQALNGGEVNAVTVIVNPLLEIVFSLALGTAMAWLLCTLEKLFFSNSNRLSLVISFVLVTMAISTYSWNIGDFKIAFSPLLVCMMLGTYFCNKSEMADDLFERVDRWTAPLYAAFFVLSGAHLELSIFKDVHLLWVGILYVAARTLGKYYGAYLSSTYCKCSPMIRKHLGVTLFPQAGVALGMVETAQCLGPEHGLVIRNIILFSVLFYELVGPTLTRNALMDAGEITQGRSEVENRKRFKKA